MVNFWGRRGGTVLEERAPAWQVSAAQEGTVRDGAAQEGTVRDGAAQEGTVREGTVREGTVREGFVPRDGALLEPGLEQVPVVVLGLAYACWRCGEVSTALVALAEDLGVLDGGDLLTCDDEASLALADRLVPDEVRRLWHVGVVRPRFTRTTGTTYLSNGCAGCDAVLGRFPLFHEALPEALATDGEAALVHLVTALVPADEWDDLVEARCS